VDHLPGVRPRVVGVGRRVLNSRRASSARREIIGVVNRQGIAAPSDAAMSRSATCRLSSDLRLP
jgi:hypothetical protein